MNQRASRPFSDWSTRSYEANPIKLADLRAAFENAIPSEPLRRDYYRAVGLVYLGSPLSTLGSMTWGGRYNAKGAFEVLYIADRPDNTLREVGMLEDAAGARTIAVPSRPHIVFTIHVDLERVCDLAAPAAQAALGVTADDLRQPWRLEVAKGKTPITHKIGAAARDAGIEAILVPSAKFPGAQNLAIFPDCLGPNSGFEIERPDGFPAGVELEVRGAVGSAAAIFKRRTRKKK